MFKYLSNLGVSLSLPDYVRLRVVVANQLILWIIFLLVVVFPIIFWGQTAILIVLLVSTIICISLLLFNALGWVYTSRFLLVTLSLAASNIGHAIILPPQAMPIAATFMQSAGLITLSFTVFDFREVRLVWTSFGLNVLQMASFFVWKDAIYLAEEGDYEFLARTDIQLFSTLIGLSILAGSLSLLLRNSWRVARKNEGQLQELQQKSKAFKKSEIQMKMILLDLEGVREDEQKRTWIASGLAKFGELIRRHQGDYLTLHRSLIAEIVKYLTVIQGGLYLLIRDKATDEPQEIRLVGCYAYSQQRYEQQTLPLDEGIVGQACKDGKIKHLKKVPEDYFRVESALGKMLPKSVLVVPAKHNGQVEAAIEVAGLDAFPEHKIEFLEELGAAIAATIIQNRLKQQSDDLLKFTQKKEARLYQQEDIMRQTLEKMVANQAEQEAKLTKYKEEITALNAQIKELQNQLDE